MTQQPRKRISKSTRAAVYNKCGGHCAYCGKQITPNEMQVDHVVPLNGWHESGPDSIENMLPACRSCNQYKSATSLELFRQRIERLPSVLQRDSVSFQIANRFNLVSKNPHDVKFYFELMEMHKNAD